jgi:hypothetical protein
MTARLVPLALTLALAGCGISRAEHQRALDEQRTLLLDCQKDLAAAKEEASKAGSEALAASARAEKAETEAATLRAGLAEAQAAAQRARAAEAVAQVREAQVAVMEKRAADAAGLLAKAVEAAKDVKNDTAAKLLEEAFAGVQKKDPKVQGRMNEAATALAAPPATAAAR